SARRYVHEHVHLASIEALAEQASQSPVAAASGPAASGSTAPTSADAPPARLSELGPAFVDGSSRTRGLRRRIRQPGDVDDSNEPVDLEVKRDEGVTIRFADGHSRGSG